MATKDLIPLNRRTKQEQKEICSKGAKASIEVRAEKKTFKTIFESILPKAVNTDKIEHLKDYIQENTILTAEQAMAMAQMIKAVQGDTKAFEVVRDTIGQKPTDKQEIEHKGFEVIIVNASKT